MNDMDRDTENPIDRDPVCGMTVEVGGPRHALHDGRSYYFCSDRCQHKFDDAPNEYLGERAESEPMPEGTMYTCPMDPRIIQEEAGARRAG